MPEAAANSSSPNSGVFYETREYTYAAFRPAKGRRPEVLRGLSTYRFRFDFAIHHQFLDVQRTRRFYTHTKAESAQVPIAPKAAVRVTFQRASQLKLPTFPPF